jgi:hypothetical protein
MIDVSFDIMVSRQDQTFLSSIDSIQVSLYLLFIY